MSEHNERSVTALLRQKYCGQEWAFVSQVPNATGGRHSRTCDGLAMSLWPSKGLQLHGFEIKVSRSDWLSEIQDLSKSYAFSRYCDYWWIVAPKGIVKIEELPAEWGLQEVTTKGNLRVKKAASLLEPETIDVEFLAGLFRATCRRGSDQEIQETYRRGKDDGRREMLDRLDEVRKHEHERCNKETERLQQAIDEFETASGIRITAYCGNNLGKKVAEAAAIKTGSKMLATIRQQAERIVAMTREAAEAAGGGE